MMKALCWHGKYDVRVEQVPDPEILQPGDVIVKTTSTAICGSDLHLYDGYIPSMMPGDILGHEFMGEIVEVGPKVERLTVGDRVVVPFTISCGNCFFCERKLWSLCDNTNPNSELAEAMYGASPAGLYGYSHLMGGYAGGQAEYVRVPFADHGPIKVPNHLPDEKLLFLTDIFPTGYQAAEQCDIQPGDTVAVFGAGPVGQFAIKSAFMLGAERVVAIDRFVERLDMAAESGSITIDYTHEDVVEALKDYSGGRGPDACIDAVGLEAHGTGVMGIVDRAKQAVRMETGRPHALRQAIQACRKGGTVSIPGVYGGFLDSINMGAAFAKGLTFKMGQTHVQNYLEPLLDEVSEGRIDPSFVITHQLPLHEAPAGYEMFQEKQDGCIKVVLKP